MSFFNFVMALSPIVVVLVGILGFRQSAKRVAPVALLWTFCWPLRISMSPALPSRITYLRVIPPFRGLNAK